MYYRRRIWRTLRNGGEKKRAKMLRRFVKQTAIYYWHANEQEQKEGGKKKPKKKKKKRDHISNFGSSSGAESSPTGKNINKGVAEDTDSSSGVVVESTGCGPTA
jgi:hypothetical protein